MSTFEKRKQTPPEVAKLLRCSPDKIIRWILAGELRAINVATRTGGRPRYLIDHDDLQDFLARRANSHLRTPLGKGGGISNSQSRSKGTGR